MNGFSHGVPQVKLPLRLLGDNYLDNGRYTILVQTYIPKMQSLTIDRTAIIASIQATAARAQIALVEGVGGFRVPLIPGWDTADLCADLQLPVVLVVGMRLGCLNHALLTAEAIRARGLQLVGWVANTIDADMPYMDDNLLTLADVRDGLQAPLWGHVPRLKEITPAAVAAHLDKVLVLNALQ